MNTGGTMTADTSHDLVTINDATRITGLEKATLYKLARTGRVRSFRVIGTALRFERADLEALVQFRTPAVAG
jgi:excisionase family DNA binding protein